MPHLKLCRASDADEPPATLRFPTLPRSEARDGAEASKTVESVEAALLRIERQMDELAGAVDDVFQLPDQSDWPPAAA